MTDGRPTDLDFTTLRRQLAKGLTLALTARPSANDDHRREAAEAAYAAVVNSLQHALLTSDQITVIADGLRELRTAIDGFPNQ